MISATLDLIIATCLRMLTIMHSFTRECSAMEVNTRLPGRM